MEDKKFQLIDGGGKNIIRPKRKSLEESQQIVCHKCKIGSAVIKITLAPRRSPSGKLIGGTKIYACAHCHARGEIVELAKA